MKILFLSHYFPPEVNAPATRTYEHCVRWARAGHDVTVITCVPNCPDGIVYDGYRNGWTPQVERLDGIRVVRTWTYVAANTGTIKRIANYVSYTLSATLAATGVTSPDVVVATSPQFFCGWSGVFTSWLKRAPLVLEIRDIWPESIVAVGALRNGPLLRLLASAEKRMYRAADHIVTVGNGYRERILEKHPSADRISVITNGVDMSRFEPCQDQRFRHLWNLEGRFVCSYVGTIGMAHGLEVVIRAAERLNAQGRRDICFCLVGDGAERQRLEAETAQRGLQQMVVFTGRQPREEMRYVLASSDACLIHLRRRELFNGVIPSKIFEAMAMGRPIVMGVEGESRELVRQAGAGIEMEPDSPDSLAAAVMKLADDAALCRQLGLSARAYVAKRFNRDQLAVDYLRLLHQVADVPVSEPLDAVPPVESRPAATR